MSDNHQMGDQPPTHGEIEHVNYLSQDIGALCLNDDYSDVTLNIDGEFVKAHKAILASRCEYFRALFYGGMKESKQTEIELLGAGGSAFKLLLKYIYTGRLSLGSLKEDSILEILGLAHKYGFQNLEKSICHFFMQTLSVQNVFSIYDAARLYQLNYLKETCKSFIDKDVAPILDTSISRFLQLSPEGLKEIIERDSFYAPEVHIFETVLAWAQANNMKGTSQLEDVLSAVRFELMSIEDLCKIVRPSGLVSSETILDALERQTILRDVCLKYRGTLNINVNMADPRFGTHVLQGEMKSALLDGNSLNYDMENGYTRHSISDGGDSIIIKLGTQCVVNHIKMLLWDKDLRSYSYYIEVSVDQKDWVRVIDHTQFCCRSWQKLYFKPRVINYVRIVGTHNSVNTVFHVVAFEIMFTNETFTLVNGIIRPKHNIATTKESASVIEGVCRSRNALLDGNSKEYDWNKGYTCHQIGSGVILVQLGQPYMLDSMRYEKMGVLIEGNIVGNSGTTYFNNLHVYLQFRKKSAVQVGDRQSSPYVTTYIVRLLLWDCDARSYSYYIEVSENRRDWEIVWDMREQFCQSWQVITFALRPVVFIKIVGTHNTANEIFHCVHFECPAQLNDTDMVDVSRSSLPSSEGGTVLN